MTCNVKSLVEDPPQKRRKSGRLLGDTVETCEQESVLYGAEVTVYDKKRRCLLTEGDYELTLQHIEDQKKPPQRKHASWETLMDGQVI